MGTDINATLLQTEAYITTDKVNLKYSSVFQLSPEPTSTPNPPHLTPFTPQLAIAQIAIRQQCQLLIRIPLISICYTYAKPPKMAQLDWLAISGYWV